MKRAPIVLLLGLLAGVLGFTSDNAQSRAAAAPSSAIPEQDPVSDSLESIAAEQLGAAWGIDPGLALLYFEDAPVVAGLVTEARRVYGDSFGGASVTYGRTGDIVISTVNADGVPDVDLPPDLMASYTLAEIRSGFSELELASFAEGVSFDIYQANPEAPVEILVDSAAMSVRISVSATADPALRQQVESIVEASGGRAVLVEVPSVTPPQLLTCPLDYSCHPLRGGLEIDDFSTYVPGMQTYYSRQYDCTSGFNAWSPTFQKYYLITAGHCMSTLSSIWQHGGSDIGPLVARAYGPPSVYDVAAIEITNSVYWNQRNWVRNSSNTTHAITSTLPNSGFYVGMPLCKMGATVGTTYCGWVAGSALIPGLGNRIVANNIPSCMGDSGGAVVSANAAIGLVSTAYGTSTTHTGVWSGLACFTGFGLVTIEDSMNGLAGAGGLVAWILIN